MPEAAPDETLTLITITNENMLEEDTGFARRR